MRLAVLRPILGFVGESQPEYVHADRAGTGAAYVYGVVATLFPQLFPTSFRDMHGGVAVYFEAAAVIITLVLLGQVLELRARQRTSGAIRELLHLAPQIAHLVSGGRSETSRWSK